MQSVRQPAVLGPSPASRETVVCQIEPHIWLKAALLFAGSFLLYYLTRSPGLDEIDSVQFAMGVRHFDLWQQTPHPPGYPLFIFLGWLGSVLFSADPNSSLHVVAAVGGALLVASWFITVRVQFNERLAWWVAGCLAITPVIWMTSTKAMTDSLACGLLSCQIVGAVRFSQTRQRSALWATILFGAAAAGARPQLFLVMFAVLAMALLRGSKIPRWQAMSAWILLVCACLLWLIPMWYIQSRLNPTVSGGTVYPHLIYKQWAMRFHNPTNFVFAGDWSAKYLGIRCVFHFLGWFGVGFGFIQSWAAFILGTIVSLAGVTAYWLVAKQPNIDAAFWKFHWPWAIVHIACIFINLPGSQRYYLVIFPLLLVLLLRGFLQLRPPWDKVALGLPGVLLLTSIPVAIANYRDDAPPVRLIQYLQRLYPPEQRGRVVLLLSTRTNRHFEWYSPDFVIVNPIPPPDKIPEITKDAVAVYTDDPVAPLPPDWYRLPLNAFTRSVIIYWKVHYLELYLLERR